MCEDWDSDSISFDESEDDETESIDNTLWDHEQIVPIDSSKDIEIDNHVFVFQRYNIVTDIEGYYTYQPITGNYNFLIGERPQPSKIRVIVYKCRKCGIELAVPPGESPNLPDPSGYPTCHELIISRVNDT